MLEFFFCPSTPKKLPRETWLIFYCSKLYIFCCLLGKFCCVSAGCTTTRSASTRPTWSRCWPTTQDWSHPASTCRSPPSRWRTRRNSSLTCQKRHASARSRWANSGNALCQAATGWPAALPPPLTRPLLSSQSPNSRARQLAMTCNRYVTTSNFDWSFGL